MPKIKIESFHDEPSLSYEDVIDKQEAKAIIRYLNRYKV